MIIAKTTVFFTALAVSTFSAISAQTPVSDAPKTTKMPRNKKTKKGGKAVHTKSRKKGKRSTSPSSSPTGVCDSLLVTRMAYEVDGTKRIFADYIKYVSEDPVLKQVEAVGALLNQAASVNAVVKSTLFGEATGCDYDTSFANYNSTLFEDYDSLVPSPSRRHLEEEYVCPGSEAGRKLADDPLAMIVKLAHTTSGSEVGRKLEDDPLAPLLAIVELAQTIIRLFLSSVIQFDKLNKVYPLYMGLLGEITCTYYALSLAVVDIVKALSMAFAGFAIDLSSPFHEGVLRCTLIVYEETDFFPEYFSIPTVFDAAACGL